MANRPQGYGFSREVAEKINSKYKETDPGEIIEWICSRVKTPGPAGDQSEQVQEWLMDGIVLHDLIESFGMEQYYYKIVDPQSKKIESMRKSVKNDNVGKFLKQATAMGVKSADLFQTVSLIEGQNMAQVMNTLRRLSSAAMAKGVEGIGVKTADKCERNFDEKTLQAGKHHIGLQMGTNQVASQSGMTGYGQGRQIIHKTN